MIRSDVLMLGLVTLLGGCAQNSPSVRPTDMSAEAHRQEAQKDTAAANRELREANTPLGEPNLVRTGGGNPEGYYYGRNVYDIRNGRLARARQLRAHAHQHEAAATQLENYEEAQCKQFPPETRAACPLLGPVVRIADAPNGVIVTFASGARVDAILAHMQCHLAFAQKKGFEVASSCPLYMKGVTIRPGTDPMAIEIIGSDAKVARQIRTRAREEAVIVERGGGPSAPPSR